MNEELMVPLFEEYMRTRSVQARDELFQAFLPLAKSIASRFLGRGGELEDLQQVAGMALLKALERYNPELGNRFVTYAVPTITGDLRNYLRDRGSSIRMPRDTQQKLQRMQVERERFSQVFFREPTARELAEAMNISPDELVLLLQVRNQKDTMSLDEKLSENAGELNQFLGEKDSGYQQLEDGEWMSWVYSKVNDLERKLLHLRFVEQLGQRETAKLLGISQMQVSRLERRILSRLRAIENSRASNS